MNQCEEGVVKRDKQEELAWGNLYLMCTLVSLFCQRSRAVSISSWKLSFTFKLF